MKKGETQGYMKKLGSGGPLSSRVEKLQHPGSSVHLLYTVELEVGYYIQLHKEAG